MSGLGLNSEALWREIREGLDPTISVKLGLALSNAYVTDPRMLGFICARYKFVAKLLESNCGQGSAVEIGCGEAFGSPIVAASVRNLLCTDVDEVQLGDNMRRNVRPAHMTFSPHDFRNAPLDFKASEHAFVLAHGVLPKPLSVVVDAAYAIDVIEHVEKSQERDFIRNIAASLNEPGLCIMGTPNATAAQYGSKWSQIGHINLKTHGELLALMQEQFRSVFMFSMNDEVVGTGYAPMSHYVWALGVGVR